MRGQQWVGCHPYLLVNEILVIILDAKFPLHLLDLGALYKYLPLDCKHLFSGHFTLPDQGDQLSSIFKLFSQPPQFVSALSISATSLANLPDLASTETNIRIGVVRILARFKLSKVSIIISLHRLSLEQQEGCYVCLP